MRAKWRARGALQARDIDGQAGEYQWCRLRESNTHVPLYEGGALPGSAKPAKDKVGQRRALRDGGCDLATGTAAPGGRSAAGQFWTFTMSNSEDAKLPRSPKRCASASNSFMHARRLSRGASRARRHVQPRGVPACIGEAEPRMRTPGQAETVVLSESFGPFGPSCLFGGGLAHRRISPVFSIRYRIDTLDMRNRHSRARRRNRPVADSTGR